jgi:hypothetical protein
MTEMRCEMSEMICRIECEISCEMIMMMSEMRCEMTEMKWNLMRNELQVAVLFRNLAPAWTAMAKNRIIFIFHALKGRSE